jgi:predicted site-specific integrase-resolvase
LAIILKVEKMVKMSLREAVKVFDISRPTLLKSLNNGKISGVKDGKGQWELDPSELSRVYQARGGKGGEDYQVNSSKIDHSFNEVGGDLKVRIQELEADLKVERVIRQAAESLAEERERHLDDLRRLLPSPSQAAAGQVKKRFGWWPW